MVRMNLVSNLNFSLFAVGISARAIFLDFKNDRMYFIDVTGLKARQKIHQRRPDGKTPRGSKDQTAKPPVQS